ncbi:MAG: aspartate ammonia-lyase [Desulfobacterales bacterium]|nr:aspartate ammonia-lyase [Desulfobacterales bacterium]MBF0397950.1 aspartate ammonia-lyase [Desulfobacterales bacterium]
MRIENDFIGAREIIEGALYGIHSIRAKENFPDNTHFHMEWYRAVGIVKLACHITYKNFKKKVLENYDMANLPIAFFQNDIIEALINASSEVADGKYFEHFIVPAVQGGAGTSINLNINEIIANAALLKLGHKLGDYNIIDPIEHANIFQSTNDVIPTALKIATIKLLIDLENRINYLRGKIEKLEHIHRNDLRVAYTQMQQAVPSSYGKLFSTYNEALSRDWWRVSKCFERIKVVNLGGSAIGTGIAVPRFFIMEVVGELQKLTNLPITRSENLSDATNNLDTIVEVHAILKSHAVNLEKIVSDIRLLSSDILMKNEIRIPQKQVGSSIMPGKINPVIPEFVISSSHKVYSNDVLISSLCGQGCLDLNAYLPVIGHALIESLKLMIASCTTLADNLICGLEVKSQTASHNLYKSPSITTALIPYIGYNKASLLAKEMKNNNKNIFEANDILKFIDRDKLAWLIEPQNLLKTGYSMKDLQ